MRVGLIIYGSLDTLSGGYLYDRQLVAHLRGCGDTVEIFSLSPGSYARHLADNFSNNLWPRLRSAQLDVLLQDELNHPSLLRLNRQLRGRVSYPVVSVVHHLRSAELHAPGESELYRWIERRYLASVDAFICNSAATQRAAVAALNHAQRPACKSVVAHPAGDRFAATLTGALTPEMIRQRAAQDGPLRVTFVGNLIRRKGLLVLLEALLKLPPGTCRLTIVGNSDIDALYMRVVYHLLAVTQLGGVALTGVLSDDELTAVLARSDVLAVPSEYEGFGIAYLEGMGFGLPAIGTSSGGAGEIIDDGVNGYLVPPNDPTALADRLLRLAFDRAELTRMSLAARERFRAQPGWNDSMARVRQALIDWAA
jgi:glycosyltransferase involved in cell wall biosynthesis